MPPPLSDATLLSRACRRPSFPARPASRHGRASPASPASPIRCLSPPIRCVLVAPGRSEVPLAGTVVFTLFEHCSGILLLALFMRSLSACSAPGALQYGMVTKLFLWSTCTPLSESRSISFASLLGQQLQRLLPGRMKSIPVAAATLPVAERWWDQSTVAVVTGGGASQQNAEWRLPMYALWCTAW